MSAAESSKAQTSDDASSGPAPAPTEGEQYECPFCVMMREGGCEPEFQAFMNCGQAAGDNKVSYDECVEVFDALRACMERNKSSFDVLLAEITAKEQEAGIAPPPPSAAESAQQQDSKA